MTKEDPIITLQKGLLARAKLLVADAADLTDDQQCTLFMQALVWARSSWYMKRAREMIGEVPDDHSLVKAVLGPQGRQQALLNATKPKWLIEGAELTYLVISILESMEEGSNAKA